MNPLSVITARILSLVTAAASLVVGLGVIGPATQGQIVAVAGVVLAAIGDIVNAWHASSAAKKA